MLIQLHATSEGNRDSSGMKCGLDRTQAKWIMQQEAVCVCGAIWLVCPASFESSGSIVRDTVDRSISDPPPLRLIVFHHLLSFHRPPSFSLTSGTMHNTHTLTHS